MCIETTDHTIPSVKSSLPCNNLLLPTSIHDDTTFSLLTECSIPISKTHEEPKNQKTLPEQSNNRHTPFTSPWIVIRIRDSPDQAIRILSTCAHTKRLDIDKVMIDEINTL